MQQGLSGQFYNVSAEGSTCASQVDMIIRHSWISVSTYGPRLRFELKVDTLSPPSGSQIPLRQFGWMAM